MEGVMGGNGSGSSDSSVVSKEETLVEQDNHSNDHFEVSDDSELELGLGLSLGVANSSKNHKQIPRILTSKDLPSPPSASSCSSLGLRTPCSTKTNNVSVGSKRAASPTGVSQVVGWPPIRAYRMNSMANQAKSVATGENNSQFDDIKRKDVRYGADENANAKSKERVPKNCLFVKVNMDGVAIGRKVDLSAHSSYESLAQMLEEMFTNRAVEKSNGEELSLMPKVTRPSKLLDGSSDFVLTYEDRDGDWMLVGDVPWGMFLSSVKRLRIMRTSEANGLAPRSEERSAKQRSRPI
ncbi:unnamed protein product [Amaranthus hypochondriacus]